MVYFKLHKVGGTTFSEALGRGLALSGGVRGAVCRDHRDSLPLLKMWRRSALSATMGRDEATMATLGCNNSSCALVPALPLRTAIVLRHPVERIVSKYYFHRARCESFETTTYYRETRNWTCGANKLPLLTWLNRSAYYVVEQRGPDGAREWAPARGVAGDEMVIKCEQLMLLGGGCDADGLRRAMAALDAIDVVGVTEHLRGALVLAEHALGLARGSMALGGNDSYLVNNGEHKRGVEPEVRAQIMRHPQVRREAALYHRALERFVAKLEQHGITDALGAEAEAAAAPAGPGPGPGPGPDRQRENATATGATAHAPAAMVIRPRTTHSRFWPIIASDAERLRRLEAVPLEPGEVSCSLQRQSKNRRQVNGSALQLTLDCVEHAA